MIQKVYVMFGKLLQGLNPFRPLPIEDEYFNRFILPHVTRAREAGIPESEIEQMVRKAISESDGILHYPGMRLRDAVDERIANG
jgi:hypothetical protein